MSEKQPKIAIEVARATLICHDATKQSWRQQMTKQLLCLIAEYTNATDSSSVNPSQRILCFFIKFLQETRNRLLLKVVVEKEIKE